MGKNLSWCVQNLIYRMDPGQGSIDNDFRPVWEEDLGFRVLMSTNSSSKKGVLHVNFCWSFFVGAVVLAALGCCCCCCCLLLSMITDNNTETHYSRFQHFFATQIEAKSFYFVSSRFEKTRRHKFNRTFGRKIESENLRRESSKCCINCCCCCCTGWAAAEFNAYSERTFLV